MSQFTKILELIKKNNGSVSCKELADNYLFHKAASRISEANKKGYVIEFIKNEDWAKSRYILRSEPSSDASNSIARPLSSPELPLFVEMDKEVDITQLCGPR